MSDDILELTPVQMDALREIGNVGAGNSATALSQIINHRIDMNVPQVSIVPLGRYAHGEEAWGDEKFRFHG